ncbi:S4 domain-containing protein, partial [Carnobacterium sp.]|uniref:S4 domain-containing protein n=1 Tax=Carnobacterium sp. TaxID=48221 RepID=UPI0028ADE528
MSQTYQFKINQEKGRLDKVLVELLPAITRSHIQQWIKEGAVMVNDKQVKANYNVQVGDTIYIEEPELVPLDVQAENIPIEVVYEDDDLLVVNKPQG